MRKLILEEALNTIDIKFKVSKEQWIDALNYCCDKYYHPRYPLNELYSNYKKWEIFGIRVIYKEYCTTSFYNLTLEEYMDNVSEEIELYCDEVNYYQYFLNLDKEYNISKIIKHFSY